MTGEEVSDLGEELIELLPIISFCLSIISQLFISLSSSMNQVCSWIVVNVP